MEDEVITVDDVMRVVDEARSALWRVTVKTPMFDGEVKEVVKAITELSHLAMMEHKEKEFWQKEYRELMAAIDKAEREGGER